ncbi:UDP-N-acetylmuramoyl-L-alanine--D-glutamate ligase [Malaciobacter mytili]|nr:UDP-N-acetylmuramoyl-L-alanine--D-glutamate ligase [Malaciobacter mytili]
MMIRVLGKGITAQALKEKFVDVTLYDDNDFNLYDKNSDEVTIVSPGIPPSNNMVKQAKNLQSDYDYLFDVMPFSIWISGTNGKTTTTQMTQYLLEKYNSVYGGNIGVPTCKLDTNAKIWILETSSFTLHYTNKAKPSLYILLPISEDHISWHGSYEEYKLAKLKPLDFMKEGEIAIIPEEFKDYPTNAYKITYKNSNDLAKEFNIDKSKIKFKEPFLLDALLAMATQKILFDEIDYEKINSFIIDKHKIEEVYDSLDRLWINDSKATNVDATINAIIPYKQQEIFLILGGDDKGANLEPLFEYIKELNIEVFAIGINLQRVLNFCKQYNIKVTACEILEKAVEEIALKHHKSAVAMLSPAAASLDQFSSYAHRGNLFKELVSKLSKI